MLAKELSRGDVLYLLRVSDNMIDMENKEVAEIAYCIRRLCNQRVYGGENETIHGSADIRKSVFSFCLN